MVGDADAAELCARLRARGPALAIVTDGAAGAVAGGSTGFWRVRSAEGGPFAVGSGDSFFAGLLVALDADPDDLPAALVLATAAAAANTLTPGAAVFDAADARRLREGVSVEPEQADRAS